jgi:hypothetical protein
MAVLLVWTAYFEWDLGASGANEVYLAVGSDHASFDKSTVRQDENPTLKPLACLEGHRLLQEVVPDPGVDLVISWGQALTRKPTCVISDTALYHDAVGTMDGYPRSWSTVLIEDHAGECRRGLRVRNPK